MKNTENDFCSIKIKPALSRFFLFKVGNKTAIREIREIREKHRNYNLLQRIMGRYKHWLYIVFNDK